MYVAELVYKFEKTKIPNTRKIYYIKSISLCVMVTRVVFQVTVRGFSVCTHRVHAMR